MKRFAVPFAAIAVFAFAYSVPADEIAPAWGGVRAELVPAPDAFVSDGEDGLPQALIERRSAEPADSQGSEVVPPTPQAPVRTVVPSSPDSGRANYGVSWVPEDGLAVQAAEPMKMAEPAAYEPARADVSVRLVITVNGEDHPVELPPASVAAVVRALSQAAPAVASATPVAASPVPPRTERTVSASGAAAAIIPRMPPMNEGGVYRLQVGSFLGPALARECFDRLAAADLDPRFELFGDKYRVVIPGVAAAEIPAIARRIGDAGFPEAWVRRESD